MMMNFIIMCAAVLMWVFIGAVCFVFLHDMIEPNNEKRWLFNEEFYKEWKNRY